ncbi:hypothetical protein ACFORO_29710 [Amycolatopsis halotolerans]|uniref:Uncharacterized protein n=1 Tax=Amycolatopsis halotolerans TaxID=330083 RepID=A0ABV7QQ30_9PSEU
MVADLGEHRFQRRHQDRPRHQVRSEHLAVLRWWLETDPAPMSAEEATGMVQNLSLRGRYWANGFEGDPPDPAPTGPESP